MAKEAITVDTIRRGVARYILEKEKKKRKRKYSADSAGGWVQFPKGLMSVDSFQFPEDDTDEYPIEHETLKNVTLHVWTCGKRVGVNSFYNGFGSDEVVDLIDLLKEGYDGKGDVDEDIVALRHLISETQKLLTKLEAQKIK